MNTKISKPDVLAVAGEMGERILGLDWSATPLGRIDTWSPSLRTTVSLVLNNRFPMLLWWTADYISIYNDAYIPVLGDKHPWGLGKPVRECWSEIWHVLQPLIDSPFRGGPSTWMEDICLIINRNGYNEETHFTVAYSPAPDATAPGGIGGVLATVNETTAQVINERALETLRKTSSYLIGCRSEQEVLVKAAQAIGENKSDFPFVLLYSIEDLNKEAQDDRLQPVRDAVETRQPVVISDWAARFDRFVPAGSREAPPQQAMAIPVMLQGHQSPAAVMIVALNPFRRLDSQYMSFIQLVTDQIAQALANATVIEAEHRRAEAMAELDKAKTLFFSNISHEFRTPITLMLGPLEELLNKPAVEWGSARLSVWTAYRNALRLLKLVNTLLEFSRIESGRSEARYVATDFAAYTRNLAGNFRPAIEKAGLRFDAETGPAIGPVYLDEGMWEKIVFNLLSNAFKYTLEGSITVRVLAVGDDAVLTVTDTGVGIPAEELPQIFDRFHRVHNTRGRTIEGTGIGLSLIRELVQLHGGTISVTSVKDKGSTFKVRIPFGKAHLPPARVGEADGNPDRHTLMEYVEEVESLLPEEDNLLATDGAFVENDRTILIVDDNADMRQHIRSVIGSRYATATAANGREALALIGRKQPALVLSDLMMPVMDGGQLLRELKQNPDTEQIPVILITARAGEESLIEGFETGADDYLIKPFAGRELLSRIKAQLRISQLRSHVAEQLEKEVEARTLDLMKANKELESFSYVTSHDLQEPLRKIQMFIDRILNEKEPAEKLLPKINESAARMRQLIQSMLTYSRLSQTEPELTDVDLGAVMTDVCRDFELVIEEKKAVVRIGKLPTVRANQFQMNQVFSNLLSNSLKFSGAGPVISVTANLVTEDQIPVAGQPGAGRLFHQICFADSGIGFEPQDSKKIFELFQRLHSKHRYSGAGIGLSIVKKIIEQHNGYITAEPGQESGATFYIWLPAEGLSI
jgi:signal transduction histidine kinase